MVILKATVLGFAILILAACGGPFPHSAEKSSEQVALGKTTYSQILAQFGKPRNPATHQLINDARITLISYAECKGCIGELRPLQSDAANEPSIRPARATTYYFYDNILVGYQYQSSYKSDNSNFDETRIGNFKKGKTSRAEVVQLLGKPTGAYVAPMIKNGVGEGIGYLYIAVRPPPFFHGLSRESMQTKSAVKGLRISFDAEGLVSDMEVSFQ